MVRLNKNTPDPFEIIVGTYEQYSLGYKVKNIVNEYKMERSFATHSHIGSVRSVASNKHYLASGGADDSVYLYDMRYRIESGRLMHHHDTVNCVAFSPEASHLFTCSNDGTIAAIRCGNWQVEKHWLKPHKGMAVNTLAIHPTGKIALSTGADGILRTWNLVKGRQAYATNLVPRLKLDAKNVTVLKWSPSGEKYLLAVNQRIDVYSVEVAGIDREINFEAKIVCVEFLQDNLIVVGLESGHLQIYDLDKSVHVVQTVAHDIRVKCIAIKDDLLVTVSSSGEIKLWRYRDHKLDFIHSVNCGVRITCLTLALPCINLMKKEEVKLEDQSEVKEKSKFRLRQEVIIEDEDNWEVTSIGTPGPETEGKSEKKRSLEDIPDVIIPKKKKKKTNEGLKKKRERSLVLENAGDANYKTKKMKAAKNSTVTLKKRKGKPTTFQQDEITPSKKAKKATEKQAEMNTVTSKKMKQKLPSSLDENKNIQNKNKKTKKTIGNTNVTIKARKKKPRNNAK